jgi:tRNA threonylcarbamoyl adenosine modification protein YeaZ
LIVLGIETATAVCSVGLAENEKFVAEYRYLRASTHAELLPEAVVKITKDARISIQEIDGFAVSIGPGSFTGLRIGLGFAKGLALGQEKPLVAVPTMEALLQSVPRLVEWSCIMLTARKGEVYRGLYRRKNDSWMQVGKVDVLPQERILEGLPDEDTFFLGDGVWNDRERIQTRKNAVFLPWILSLPSGYGVAEKGVELLNKGIASDLDQLVPSYIKRFQGVE